MSYETPDGTTHIDKTEARAGRRVKAMPIILGLSTLAAIIVLAAVFVFLT